MNQYYTIDSIQVMRVTLDAIISGYFLDAVPYSTNISPSLIS